MDIAVAKIGWHQLSNQIPLQLLKATFSNTCCNEEIGDAQ